MQNKKFRRKSGRLKNVLAAKKEPFYDLTGDKNAVNKATGYQLELANCKKYFISLLPLESVDSPPVLPNSVRLCRYLCGRGRMGG